MGRTVTPPSGAQSLRAQFPPSLKMVVYRSSRWLSWSLLCTGAMIYLRFNLPPLPITPMVADRVTLRILQFAVTLLLLKLTYELLYLMRHEYLIDRESLVVRRGVLRRTTASLPLAKITDVCLQRDWLQLVLGLWTMSVLTPAGRSPHGSIEGLDTSCAHALHDYLIGLLDAQRRGVHPEPHAEQERRNQLQAPSP